MTTGNAKRVFFVGGAPKSGTTWLRVLLDAHPEIACGGEGHFVNRLLPLLDHAIKQYNSVIEGKNKVIFTGQHIQPTYTSNDVVFLLRNAIHLALGKLPKARTALAIGDKTPDNVLHFSFLAKLFPDARFIDIVRDGRDCAVSAWFHNLRVNPKQMLAQSPTLPAFATFFADVWSRNASVGAGFAAEHPGRCMTVRYEDMVRDPLATLEQLCGFLGASRDAVVLRACVESGEFDRLSGGRQPGQEDRGSFYRKGIPGDWRNHLDAAAAAAFVAKAEPWMTHYKYV